MTTFKTKIGILDYGMGNIASVKQALRFLNEDHTQVKVPKDLSQCSALIIPGVGSFGRSLAGIEAVDGLKAAVQEYHNAGNLILGICLGMQLLFDESEESEGIPGLGFIRGSVQKISINERVRPDISRYKVPVIGWQKITVLQENHILKPSSLQYFYFVHSYQCAPECSTYITSTYQYASSTIVSSVQKDNAIGLQFHPEKSGKAGLALLKSALSSR